MEGQRIKVPDEVSEDVYKRQDLLLLEGMPVESLARRGYLADIGELLEGDPEVCLLYTSRCV